MPAAATAPRLNALRRDAARDVAVGVLVACVAAGVAQEALGLSPAYPALVLAVSVAGASAILAALPGHLPHAGFGPANRVSLARAVLLALMAGLLGEAALDEAARWTAGVAALAVIALDAVDGAVARRTGCTSRFGAAFDIEIDAAMTLVLAALVVRTGAAGPWVLAAGALRYAFLLAGRVWPALARPLAPSWRRRLCGGAATLALVLAVAPLLPEPASRAMLATAVGALALSFTADIVRLGRRARGNRDNFNGILAINR